MKFSGIAWAAAALAAAAFGGEAAMQNVQKPIAGQKALFSFGGEGCREFLLDGKPFQIRSGEMHPQRIPRSHWRQRIRAAKAMGLNTIAFYCFWNALEQPDGSWDFSGRNDIAAFIDLCAEEGMWVLFRPGPYVCGEWDLGGLPAYLLRSLPAPLRTTRNGEFMKAQQRYLEQMAGIAIPRLCKNGGPILMIQLENEYGSYRSEHDEMAYIEWLRDFWTRQGADRFYVSEGTMPAHLRFVPEGVAVGLDPAENERDLVHALKVAKNAPVFSSETYPGWLRHWREGNWLPTRETLNSVRWYMQTGFSFNLFVLHGGTSFGLTAGANSKADGTQFQPDLTSYDYGSPVGEQGNLTREYFEYRDIITAALPPEAAVPEPPEVPVAIEFPELQPERVARMGELKMQVRSGCTENPVHFEAVGQNQGMAVYSTTLPAGEAGVLRAEVHDYAQVYLGRQLIGTLDRSLGQSELPLPARASGETLSLLVDTFGHINFTAYTEKDFKGLGSVMLDEQPLHGWTMALLPLENTPAEEVGGNRPGLGEGALFRAELTLEEPADTFIDMSRWSKGYVWVNGHLLGRYWKVGPQQRLYCPGEFLRAGKNRIEILDTLQSEPSPIRGCRERNTEVEKRTESLNNNW
ncbi:MAG: beta-galactosidase [Akkermansia sp.]